MGSLATAEKTHAVAEGYRTRRFIWSIWSVWFNQTNETDQINEIDQMNQRVQEIGIFCFFQTIGIFLIFLSDYFVGV